MRRRTVFGFIIWDRIGAAASSILALITPTIWMICCCFERTIANPKQAAVHRSFRDDCKLLYDKWIESMPTRQQARMHPDDEGSRKTTDKVTRRKELESKHRPPRAGA
ncbi:MAG: hypothetical protein KDA54_07775, partial [Phycisphaerales bacterium]|nr:hypothetical protein [Phycisphaerales bacterium]